MGAGGLLIYWMLRGGGENNCLRVFLQQQGFFLAYQVLPSSASSQDLGEVPATCYTTSAGLNPVSFTIQMQKQAQVGEMLYNSSPSFNLIHSE